MALTRKQKQVLDLIARFVEQHGYSPSYQEIADELKLASLATVHKHILALEAKHYLRRGFNRSRSIDLSPKYLEEERRRCARAGGEVPLAGRIAAGTPVEAIPGRDTLNLGEFLADEDMYALEVRGDSMIEDHICDGDVVLVERSARIKDGDIVVAVVSGDQATLKRFFRESETTVRLQPANAAMPPIQVPLSDLEIQGRVLAVLRKYK
ncbi:MAG: transcriptional repressor LexA [Bryobacterales bacterium]|nr:transcriptional repressor LexA [Bryobacterales bacterium]